MIAEKNGLATSAMTRPIVADRLARFNVLAKWSRR